MNSTPSVKSESGIDLLQRLAVRPKLIGLQPELFGLEDPKPGDVIEINEKNCCVKNILLTQWIIQCILPSKWNEIEIGGMDVGVVFLSTDHHFSPLHLVSTLQKRLKRVIHQSKRVKHDTLAAAIKEITKDSLKRLSIYESFSKTELLFNFCSVKTFILSHSQTSVVIVDSLSAYYWEDRLSSVNMQSLDKYCQNLLNSLIDKLRQTNITIIYTMQQFLRETQQERDADLTPTFVYSITFEADNTASIEDRRTSSSYQKRFKFSKGTLQFE